MFRKGDLFSTAILDRLERDKFGHTLQNSVDFLLRKLWFRASNRDADAGAVNLA